ncbi:hypothetical protein BU26DRAFT_522899 [Trematosphaeria pertusa]|uniref:Uncharacterized protein n=1 Tax=Trematosphaeria pertusa TaxID=390896 RepID=A0A6A6I2V7_9PLEO|nr:uncharacterized protein BU26DRAFT_522899 [Trematosphaeria pertusa]KAF2244213.1 hypothetical protein BU26DRAFT_522899 [Trematosphaeria pertusa]
MTRTKQMARKGQSNNVKPKVTKPNTPEDRLRAMQRKIRIMQRKNHRAEGRIQKATELIDGNKSRIKSLEKQVATLREESDVKVKKELEAEETSENDILVKHEASESREKDTDDGSDTKVKVEQEDSRSGETGLEQETHVRIKAEQDWYHHQNDGGTQATHDDIMRT